jgi:hypothetical protein
MAGIEQLLLLLKPCHGLEKSCVRDPKRLDCFVARERDPALGLKIE